MRVEELVAAVGVHPQAVAGDRQRADVRHVPSATATTGVPKSANRSLPWWAPVSARKAPNGPPIVVAPPTGNTNCGPISRFASRRLLAGGFGVAVGSGVAVGLRGRRRRRGRGRLRRRRRRRRRGRRRRRRPRPASRRGRRRRRGQLDLSPAPPSLAVTTVPAVERVGLPAADGVDLLVADDQPADRAAVVRTRRRCPRRSGARATAVTTPPSSTTSSASACADRRQLAGRRRRPTRTRRRARSRPACWTGTLRTCRRRRRRCTVATRPERAGHHRRRRPGRRRSLRRRGGRDDHAAATDGKRCEESNRHPKSVPDRTFAPDRASLRSAAGAGRSDHRGGAEKSYGKVQRPARRRPARRGRAPYSACSAPTAPARRPPSASSPRCSTPTRARRASPAWTCARRQGAARPHRPRRPVRGRRREPDRLREPRHGRAPLPPGQADRARARRRAARALRADDAADRPSSTYSGGMRRRLDLAAALVARPPVLFLDEPTTGLDPRSRIGLWETIEARVAEGTTVLLTTQYLDEADRLADRICVIDHGQVIAEGTSRRAQGPHGRRAAGGQAARHGRRGEGDRGAQAHLRRRPRRVPARHRPAATSRSPTPCARSTTRA